MRRGGESIKNAQSTMKIAGQEMWVLAFLMAPEITWDKITSMSPSDFHADSGGGAFVLGSRKVCFPELLLHI